MAKKNRLREPRPKDTCDLRHTRHGDGGKKRKKNTKRPVIMCERLTSVPTSTPKESPRPCLLSLSLRRRRTPHNLPHAARAVEEHRGNERLQDVGGVFRRRSHTVRAVVLPGHRHGHGHGNKTSRGRKDPKPKHAREWQIVHRKPHRWRAVRCGEVRSVSEQTPTPNGRKTSKTCDKPKPRCSQHRQRSRGAFSAFTIRGLEIDRTGLDARVQRETERRLEEKNNFHRFLFNTRPPGQPRSLSGGKAKARAKASYDTTNHDRLRAN